MTIRNIFLVSHVPKSVPSIFGPIVARKEKQMEESLFISKYWPLLKSAEDLAFDSYFDGK